MRLKLFIPRISRHEYRRREGEREREISRRGQAWGARNWRKWKNSNGWSSNKPIKKRQRCSWCCLPSSMVYSPWSPSAVLGTSPLFLTSLSLAFFRLCYCSQVEFRNPVSLYFLPQLFFQTMTAVVKYLLQPVTSETRWCGPDSSIESRTPRTRFLHSHIENQKDCFRIQSPDIDENFGKPHNDDSVMFPRRCQES